MSKKIYGVPVTTPLNPKKFGPGTVYVGTGEIPEGYTFQIDPEGEDILAAYVKTVNGIAPDGNGNVEIAGGPSEVNAELQGIRVGWDGTQYDNAGEAVRKQVSSLSEKIANQWDAIMGDGLRTYPAWMGGTYVDFSTGVTLTPMDTEPYNKTRKRTVNPVFIRGGSIITIADGYVCQPLPLDSNGKTSTTLTYYSAYIVPTDAYYCFVIKASDGGDISGIDANDIFSCSTNTEIQSNTKRLDAVETMLYDGIVMIPVEWENGTFYDTNVGSYVNKYDAVPFNKTRQRTTKGFELPPCEVIAADGYLVNVFGVTVNGLYSKIETTTGYVPKTTIENAGVYWILVKAEDDSDISSVDMTAVVLIQSVSLTEKINRTMAQVGITTHPEWEAGTYVSFTSGDKLSKLDGTYSKTRQRVNPLWLFSGCEIESTNGIVFNVLRLSDNHLIASTSGYASKATIYEDGLYAIVAKSVNDGDISTMDMHDSIVFITASRKPKNVFDRGMVYWSPVQNGLEYIPTVTVDAVRHNFTSPVDNILSDWRQLVANSNGYLTLIEKGKDASGEYDIFHVIAKETGYNQWCFGTTKPKIILGAGVHGNERESVYALYYLIYDIVHNWRQNKVLEYLRFNCDLVIMPLDNPWGFANNISRNSNDVQLNWNFDDKDHSIGYKTDNVVAGNAPFSEVETQYMKQTIDENVDAVVYFDFHTCGAGVDAEQIFTYHDFAPNHKRTDYNMLMMNAARQHLEYCNRHYPIDYNLDTIEGKIYGFLNGNSPGGYSYSYSESLGVHGHVVECGCHLPGKDRVESFYSAENLTAAVRTFGQWLQVALETIYKSI